MSTRSHVTTHILDTATGRPAAGVPVKLAHWARGSWDELAAGLTDDDGRVAELGPEQLAAGRYRLTFDAALHFRATGRETFFPVVEIVFDLAEPEQHYHVPLLLSPFGYSTYRGS